MSGSSPHSPPTRRALLRGAAALAAAAASAEPAAAGVTRQATDDASAARDLVRPPRLKSGDRVGLVNPATAAFDPEWIDIARETLESLGLEVVLSPNYFARRGYLAGTDAQRAADLMGFVHDPKIRGIWARGGWGSARILPHLDYGAIRANPKVIVGYSDSTALLSGIRKQADVVTFHGPFPKHRFTARAQEDVLFRGLAPKLANPVEVSGTQTVATDDRVRTLTPGKATGHLVGGNLTVLTSIVGTPYLPSFDGAILFIEDVDEAIYRIDRMLTQLALAGLLGQVNGVVFGRCTDCPTGSTIGGLTLEDVLHDHLDPLGVPAFRGSMIGHIDKQFTLPIGGAVEIDADEGTIQLLEPGVS